MFKRLWHWVFGCKSRLNQSGCQLKRGHLGSHRGPHWSGRTLYWRELDTSELQELINSIRAFDNAQPIGNLREMSKAWQIVMERTDRLQGILSGRHTVGK